MRFTKYKEIDLGFTGSWDSMGPGLRTGESQVFSFFLGIYFFTGRRAATSFFSTMKMSRSGLIPTISMELPFSVS